MGTISASLNSLERKLSIKSGLKKVGLIAGDSWTERRLISATHSKSPALPFTLKILFHSLASSEKWDHEQRTYTLCEADSKDKQSSSSRFLFFFLLSLAC